MSSQLTQQWIEQSLHEINDLESCSGTVDTFQGAIDSYESNSGKKTPVIAAMFHDFLRRYAPEDMVFSFPAATMLIMASDRPALTQMYAWSLVIETLKAGRTLTLRDFRHAWGPLSIPTDDALSGLWKSQKVNRDPVTRSDNWLDLAEAWTLEGLARKNADA